MVQLSSVFYQNVPARVHMVSLRLIHVCLLKKKERRQTDLVNAEVDQAVDNITKSHMMPEVGI